jgi:hypothetical protein
MNRSRIFWTGVILLCLLITASGVMAMSSAGYRLDWFAPLDGSGGSASSANYQVDFTTGQVIGVSGSTSYSACTGFWCGTTRGGRVLLPMVQK